MSLNEPPPENQGPTAPDKGPRHPIEKVHHDLHRPNVTRELFHQAERFIRACECVGVWRLKSGERSAEAGFYLAELAARIVESLRALIESGDIMLARKLPPLVAATQRAEAVYGMALTNQITKRRPIEELLKEHRPIEL